MAKIRLGALAGQVSGSIGCETYSHNRYGTYIRNRSIPTQPDSATQLNRRANMTAMSSRWGTLTAAVQLSWKIWAQNNPIVDSLGDKRILDGHAAYVALNSRMMIQGWTTSDTPPITPAPVPLKSLSITASAGTQNVTVTFATSPPPANTNIWIWGAKTPTASIHYINNLLRWLDSDAVGGGSPYTLTALATKLGALVQGEQIIVRVAMASTTCGQISTFLEARCACGA